MQRRRSLKGLGSFVGDERWPIASVALSALVGAIFEAAAFLIIVKVALVVATQAHGVQLGPLDLTASQALTTTFVLVLASMAAGLVNSRTSAKVTSRVVASSRKRLAGAFLRASWDAQSQERQGNLHQLLTGHISQITRAISILSTGLSAASSFLAFTVSAAVVSVSSFAVIVAAVALMGGVLIPISRMTKRRGAAVGVANIEYATRLAQVTSVASELHVFDVANRAAETLDDAADLVAERTYHTTLISRLTSTLYRGVMLGLLVLGLTVVYLLGAHDVGNLGAVVVLLLRAMSYSQTFTSSFQQLSVITPLLDQAYEQELSYRDNVATFGTKELPVVGSVAMTSVSFSYSDGVEVLHDVTFAARCGEAIGLVGPSGSGKSTLAQLLLRLRTPGTGSYLVNAESAETYSATSWARRVGFVPQDVALIRGTIADNIRFFRDDVTDEDVVAAARAAHVDDEIMSLPDGYDTTVGSGARDLSGGQRQRIGFARALAAKPDIIVLDEPTSALDMRSESLVQQTLRSLKGSVTTFIIAHRLSTIADCDKILVLDHGRVAGFGPAAEVAEKNGFLQEALRLSRLPS
jgi:ABC-type multidrug transport system fused ATPase/permease subunit